MQRILPNHSSCNLDMPHVSHEICLLKLHSPAHIELESDGHRTGLAQQRTGDAQASLAIPPLQGFCPRWKHPSTEGSHPHPYYLGML